MNLLAIDPGASSCAFALFTERVLCCVWFAETPVDCVVHEVVVERMQADERTRHIDVRHLLACQASGMRAAGVAEGRGARFTSLSPTEWKGSEQKPIQHARMWDRVLGPPEREALGGANTRAMIERALEKGASRRWRISGAECYPRAWPGHNLLDAAALGCVYLGRMGKR